jgi:hypothetical protein
MELLRLLGHRLYIECLVGDGSMGTGMARMEEEGNCCIINAATTLVFTFIFGLYLTFFLAYSLDRFLITAVGLRICMTPYTYLPSCPKEITIQIE